MEQYAAEIRQPVKPGFSAVPGPLPEAILLFYKNTDKNSRLAAFCH